MSPGLRRGTSRRSVCWVIPARPWPRLKRRRSARNPQPMRRRVPNGAQQRLMRPRRPLRKRRSRWRRPPKKRWKVPKRPAPTPRHAKPKPAPRGQRPRGRPTPCAPKLRRWPALLSAKLRRAARCLTWCRWSRAMKRRWVPHLPMICAHLQLPPMAALAGWSCRAMTVMPPCPPGPWRWCNGCRCPGSCYAGSGRLAWFRATGARHCNRRCAPVSAWSASRAIFGAGTDFALRRRMRLRQRRRG